MALRKVWLSSLSSSFGHGEAKEWRLSVFKVFYMSNVLESVSSHIKTLELRKKSNSTANAFATVAYSCEMETDFLRAFVPPVRGDVTFVWESLQIT
ncbi:hypothetical protein N9M16_03550 [Candidatus Dependentiae bacterium]|nr:hypothetical protein [Candidatus Dependentiae bacterium]